MAGPWRIPCAAQDRGLQEERECLLVVKALVRDVGELDPNPGAVTGFLCDAGQSWSPASAAGVELNYQQLVY